MYALTLPPFLWYTTITEVEGMRAGYLPAECGEFDYLEDLHDFEQALVSIGIEPCRLGYGTALVVDLLEKRPPLLWNLNSGLIGESREAQVPSLCEMLNIPIVGPGSWNAAITQDKSVCSAWLKEKMPDLSQPQAVHVVTEDELRKAVRRLPFPAAYIIKANNEDSSRALDEESLQSTSTGVMIQAKRILNQWGAVRIEEFIRGFDISANLACEPDGTLLPLEPVLLTTRRGIHDETCRLNGDYERQLLKEVDSSLANQVKQIAKRIGVACRFREYARLDLRLDPENGRVFFLEANITPSFNVDGDYVWAARETGLDLEVLLSNIVASAWKRAQETPAVSSIPYRIRKSTVLWETR